MFSKTLALAILASAASGHIIITNPVPYGKSSLTNGPLLADGSDFPCKQRSGVYDADGASNIYKQGSTQQLNFQGTAVHGGGSCQVSVTKDLKPTKDSVWKVIKSIEGGCPAKDQTGNLGDNASAPVPYKYDFDIPKDLKEGNYTLAWTWFNKVGNREMYMNCAPLTVEGSGGSDSFMSSLPDMFVANIGNGCTVPPSKDVQFPDPGKDVDKFNGKTEAWYMPTGSACGKSSGGGGGSSGDSPAPTTTADSGQAAASGAQSAPSNSAPGGVFITQAPSGSQPTEAPTSNAADPPQTTAVSSFGSGSGSGSGSGNSGGSDGGSSGGSGGGFAAGSACSSEGSWNCIGGSSFQRCASGVWTGTQPMAGGVSCTSGQSSDLKMAAAGAKRGLRHAVRMLAWTE